MFVFKKITTQSKKSVRGSDECLKRSTHIFNHQFENYGRQEHLDIFGSQLHAQRNIQTIHLKNVSLHPDRSCQRCFSAEMLESFALSPQTHRPASERTHAGQENWPSSKQIHQRIVWLEPELWYPSNLKNMCIENHTETLLKIKI